MFLKYTIDIPEPCDEGWQNMTPSQKGRFCASCQKEVIDFTQLSSSDITRKIKSRKNLCGRFTKDQLQQNYTTSSHNNLSRLGIALGLGSIITVAQPSFAQEKPIKVKTEQSNVRVLGELAETQTQNDTITITGTVTDEQGLPLAGTNVILKNTAYGTQTDFDGNFSIKIPENYIKRELEVEFTYIGFITQEFKVDNKFNHLKVKMQIDPEIDDIVIGTYQTSKSHFFQRFLNLFRSKENKRHF